MEELLLKSKRVVVKVGTSNLTDNGCLSLGKVKNIVDKLVALKKNKKELILVSSGAIAAGMSELSVKHKSKDVKMLQATAAVGQNELMKAYGKNFSDHKLKVAQILLTYEDFDNQKRRLNLRNTVNTLLDMNVVPIINENDTVAVDEIKLGDNDNLSALVAVNLKADLLVVISDGGLCTNDPKHHEKAKLIKIVDKITDKIVCCAGECTSLGTGGMKTKLQAAKTVTKAGIPMIVTALGKETLVSDNSTLFKAK